MAPPTRLRPSPATRRYRGSPAFPPPTLILPEAAITALRRDTSATRSGDRVPKALNISALTKCDHDMTSADFRTWRRSVEDWLSLHDVKDRQAVCYIRLLCVPAVQKALDARNPRARWDALSSAAALDSVGKLVLRECNQAVCWADFFSAVQAPGEPVREYFTKCSQKALDCAFECPECDGDISEYMLLRKLVAGLHEPALRREVFQSCDQFKDLDTLRTYCVAYEAAHRDATAGTRHEAVVAADVTDYVTATKDIIAAAQVAAHCRNCGGRHPAGRPTCPARNATCRACGKSGHFQKTCRSTKRHWKTDAMASTVIAEVHRTSQPRLNICVAAPGSGDQRSVMAVADTGAQVCMAGRQLMRDLGMTRQGLQDTTVSIKHLAGGRLRVLGGSVCTLSLGARSTQACLYFAEGVQELYLSLQVCKALGLVPPDFPTVLATVGALVQEEEPQLPNRPSTPPYALTEDNVHLLERWFLEHFGRTAFAVDRTPLPQMKGPPHHIHLRPDTQPHAVHSPASVPHHFYDDVLKQLQEDVRRGVIEPVPAGEPTEWCSRMVVVPKKDGRPRRTVDFQRLNQASLRETHHTRPPFDAITGVPKHTYKTVADAYSGYHQIPLDEESRKLTTFITPWGRFRYLRTPMGHCAAQDAFTKRFDDVVTDVPKKLKCVDDALLYDHSIADAFWHTYQFLSTCAENGITLRPDKFRFCRRSVSFAGYMLGWEDYRPSQDLISSISGFQMPSRPSLTDVRSWFGLVNQVAPFLSVTPLMEPFRELLKKPSGKVVYWDGQLQSIFETTKETISKLAAEGLRYYDITRPTAVFTDYSRLGIGFVVMQQYCQCVSQETPLCCKGGWRLALCGSRHLTSAEQNYSTLEGEALAIAWCLKKARLFLLGCPNLTFITDHRALTKIFHDKELKDITNPRVLNLKEKTLMYSFHVKYLKGEANRAADALSRYPVLRGEPDETDLAEDEATCASVVAAMACALENDEGVVVDLSMVEEKACQDEDYRLLHARVSAGDWAAQKDEEPLPLRPYYRMRRHLSCHGDIVMYATDEGHLRVVIPTALRRAVLANLHSGHQGRDSMLRRARQSIYWPGIDAEVEQKRRQCQVCEVNAPSSPVEPLLPTPPPIYPFQHAVVDLFQLSGEVYVTYADRLTGWLEIEHFPTSSTSSRLISTFRRWFRRFGIPEVLSCDGGTNLVSEEARTFLSAWRVQLRVSSAHYPQSNGRAEAAVKSAKRLLRGNTGPRGSLESDAAATAILQYLNTPLQDTGASPAQLLMGRQLRDSVPAATEHYRVSRQWARMLRDRERAMVHTGHAMSMRFNRTAHDLTPLTPGQQVRLQNQETGRWDRVGIVVDTPAPRQYLIRLHGSGRASLRNRRHLRPSGYDVEQLATPGREDAAQGVDYGGGRREGATLPSTPPARPQRARRAPTHLADYVLTEGLP